MERARPHLKAMSTDSILYKRPIAFEFFSRLYLASAMTSCGVALTPPAVLLSALAHCEMAAVEMASVIKIMMMAANCARLFASSFILPSPESPDLPLLIIV